MSTEPQPVIRATQATPASEVERSRGATIKVLLGPEDRVPHFATREFTLRPGGRIPAHSHDRIEHEQVVLEGEMTIGLGEATHVVRPGDSIFIPAGLPHWYENRTDQTVRFLCMVPLTDAYQTTWLEEPAG